MKTLIYPCLCLLFLFATTTQAQRISGKGPIVSEEFNLDAFTGVGLAMAGKVTITKGPRQKVIVHGQKNVLAELNREVKNGTWSIGTDQKINNYESLKVEITLSELTSVLISGSGQIKTADAFSTNQDFKIAISGSGNAEVQIDAPKVDCSISGSGDAFLRGSADELRVNIAGSGDVEAYDLAVKECSVKTAGSGDTEVNVSEHLNVSIVGSGDVHYAGDPKVKASTLGSGRIRTK